MAGLYVHNIIKIEISEIRKLDLNSYSTKIIISSKESRCEKILKTEITLFSNEKINLTVL